MEILARKDAINHHKDAINRRLYERLIIVETAIHRVCCLNRTVLDRNVTRYNDNVSMGDRVGYNVGEWYVSPLNPHIK